MDRLGAYNCEGVDTWLYKAGLDSILSYIYSFRRKEGTCGKKRNDCKTKRMHRFTRSIEPFSSTTLCM